jgi:hypothetical protein
MKDTFEFTLNSPLTEEQWDMITDVDFDRTDRITFHTKHGKEVEFTKVIRCKDCKHRPYKDERGHIVPPEEDEECSPCPCVDDGDWYYNYIPEDDWYCANGEPKEKET